MFDANDTKKLSDAELAQFRKVAVPTKQPDSRVTVLKKKQMYVTLCLLQTAYLVMIIFNLSNILLQSVVFVCVVDHC